MKSIIKYLLGVVVGVLMCSATAFAMEYETIYDFFDDEYIVSEINTTMYTVKEDDYIPANISLRIIGLTNKDNYVLEEWQGEFHSFYIMENNLLSSTFDTNYGTQLSQNDVYQKLIALQKIYPENMSWTVNNTYDWDNSYIYGMYSPTGIGCSAFAHAISDAIFGAGSPAYCHYDFNNIKVGDIISLDRENHDAIVLAVDDNYITIVEGNYSGTVHWGRKIKRSSLYNWGNCIVTRY